MDELWWRDATVYQLYLRSFADGNGDGVGDLAGLRSRLGYLRDLGVDAVWLNPCYASPQRDHGYDIADYLRPDPAYGELAELEAFIAEAHGAGIRVLMDMVANHCSSDHDWFRAALASAPGSAARARFLFRDGRGDDGALPPNNWQSVFGGPAWTRVAESDGTPGQWYFHAFDPGQPDFDWRNPEVAAYFERVLRHWFDLGVDGFRVDVAHGLVKQAGLDDWPGADDGSGGHNSAMWDQPEVHDVYRAWRAIGQQYDPPRYFVGEIWVPDLAALARYVADDEMHQAFTFDLLVQPWSAGRIRGAIERALQQAAQLGRTPAWTLSNHDVHRTVTRYGQEQVLDDPDPSDMIAAARRRGEVDLPRGIRRARAAAALELALPGTVYLYQGEELGLPEVLDLPDEVRQDPIWLRSDGAELGRDGCRVPLPWVAASPTLGFSSTAAAAAPWLPQPATFADFAVDRQDGDPASVLELYRRLIRLRSEIFTGDALEWLPTPSSDLIAFRRGRGVCVVNLGSDVAELPADWTGEIVARTGAEHGHVVHPDCAVWLVLDREPVVVGEPADGVRQDSPTPQRESQAA